jgi:hypothetical protein
MNKKLYWKKIFHLDLLKEKKNPKPKEIQVDKEINKIKMEILVKIIMAS